MRLCCATSVATLRPRANALAAKTDAAEAARRRVEASVGRCEAEYKAAIAETDGTKKEAEALRATARARAEALLGVARRGGRRGSARPRARFCRPRTPALLAELLAELNVEFSGSARVRRRAGFERRTRADSLADVVTYDCAELFVEDLALRRIKARKLVERMLRRRRADRGRRRAAFRPDRGEQPVAVPLCVLEPGGGASPRESRGRGEADDELIFATAGARVRSGEALRRAPRSAAPAPTRSAICARCSERDGEAGLPQLARPVATRAARARAPGRDNGGGGDPVGAGVGGPATSTAGDPTNRSASAGRERPTSDGSGAPGIRPVQQVTSACAADTTICGAAALDRQHPRRSVYTRAGNGLGTHVLVSKVSSDGASSVAALPRLSIVWRRQHYAPTRQADVRRGSRERSVRHAGRPCGFMQAQRQFLYRERRQFRTVASAVQFARATKARHAGSTSDGHMNAAMRRCHRRLARARAVRDANG